MNERIQCQIDEHGVAEVALARPDKLNALDIEMFDALVKTIESLRQAPGLRAVVLHGQGRGFCAGLDMGRMRRIAQQQEGGMRDLRARTHGPANAAQYAVWGWRQLPVPVFAAVHGVAYGGGLQVALGADCRYVTADTQMSVMEMKWGLVPDMAGMALMRALVREDKLRELVLTHRVVGGEEAVALGLATAVVADPLAHARQMAREVAGKSPSAVRAAKRLLNTSAGLDDALAARLLQAESDEQVALMGGAHQIEAALAGLEGRPARFTD